MADSCILVDYLSTLRQTSEGLDYPRPYLGEDPLQTATLENGYLELTTGAGSHPYLHFQSYGPSGYNSPGGSLSDFIKAGEVFSNSINRMTFGIRASRAFNRPTNGAGIMQMGSYIRNPDNSSSSYAGVHPYQHFGNNYVPDVYVKHIAFDKPTHMVGMGSGINWPVAYGPAYRGRNVQQNSTSQSTFVKLVAADGVTPITSYATVSAYTWNYARNQESPSPTFAAAGVSMSNLAAADSAFTAGGMFHLGDGWWRVDPPNDAWTVNNSLVQIGNTNTAIVKYSVNHKCFAGATNTAPDLATETNETNRGNYFQRMTRFYKDHQEGATLNFENTVFRYTPVRLYTVEATEPVFEICNITLQYNGTRWEVTWNGRKNIARTYEIRYRTDGLSMRDNGGFLSGIDGSTVANQGNDYEQVFWASANMAESVNGLYVAIRVQGQTDYTEQFLPYQYGPGNDGYAEQYEGGEAPPESTPIVLGIFN